MSEIQLTHFTWDVAPTHETRDPMHATATRDARIAVAARSADAPARRTGLVERLGISRARLAFAGGPAITADCSCPA